MSGRDERWKKWFIRYTFGQDGIANNDTETKFAAYNIFIVLIVPKPQNCLELSVRKIVDYFSLN